MNRFNLFLAFITLYGSSLYAQSIEREQLQSAYTYTIAKNIEWPLEKDEYQIRVITSNERLVEAFTRMSSVRKLNGKPMRVSFSQSSIIPNGTDLVFVGSDFNSTVKSVLNQITGNPILLITDGFNDDLFIMVNFIDSENQTLRFEINRANIINQDLKILDEILLEGGSDVDVARIYRVAQDSIKKMEQRVLGLQGRFDSLSLRVSRAMETISDQNETIDQQIREISTKQKIVNEQEIELDSLALQFDESENRLDSLIGYLEVIRSELSDLESEVDNQRKKVAEGDETLAKQGQEIKERDQEIASREAKLEEMSTAMDSQENKLWLLILFSIILIVFTIIIFSAYKARKTDARKLALQKEKLENTLLELRDAQSQLVQSEKMASLGVLTAGIAHEINNATNYVYSGIYILKERLADISSVIDKVDSLNGKTKNIENQVEEIVKEKEEVGYSELKGVVESMITSIQVGAERTADIVKGLKIFSRSETESRTEVNIHEDIDIALLLLESRHKNIIEMVKKFDQGTPMIEGYSGQLSQAFLNIIGNAIDALRNTKKPKITIKTKQKKNFVEISVKDNGPGVPKDIQDKIFDPFFTTKQIGVGTGLGLSITFGIIEKHQGKIKLNSSDRGAEFIIKLPVKNIEI